MDATSQGVFADARFAPNYQRCSRIGAFRYRQEVNDPSSSNEVWRAFARGASSEHRLSLPLRAASRPTTTLTDKFEAYAIPKFASTAIFSHPCAISPHEHECFQHLGARTRARRSDPPAVDNGGNVDGQATSLCTQTRHLHRARCSVATPTRPSPAGVGHAFSHRSDRDGARNSDLGATPGISGTCKRFHHGSRITHSGAGPYAVGYTTSEKSFCEKSVASDARARRTVSGTAFALSLGRLAAQ